jgi:glutaminyl-tRNA synthetase
VERSLWEAPAGGRWQFERIGYFCADMKDSRPGKPVFNRIVSLRDTWSKIAARK